MSGENKISAPTSFLINHQSALTSWIDPAGGCVSDPGKARDMFIDHQPDRKRYAQFFETATATSWRSWFGD
jgi:hypothetical protein